VTIGGGYKMKEGIQVKIEATKTCLARMMPNGFLNERTTEWQHIQERKLDH
jgi:hypothetical protein